MIRSYDQTWTIRKDRLKDAFFYFEIFENTKYEDKEPVSMVEYTGVTSWDMIEGGKEAEELEAHFNEIDEKREYCVLHFENGETATFRNSHIDMWIEKRSRTL